MLKRKSHNKSRKGCQNCKRRHVKCDEQGPPCANCVVRETSSTCIYTQSSQSSLSAVSSRGQDAAASGRRGGGDRDQAVAAGSTSPSESRSPAPEPAAATKQQELAAAPARSAPSEGESSRLLDLELMHRWSTVTYKSLISVPADESYLQVGIPIEALKAGYLLNALLAVTALEKVMSEGSPPSSPSPGEDGEGSGGGGGGSSSMAATGNSERIRARNRRYIRAAIEYYDRAINAFRAALPTVGPENHHMLYFASILAAIVHLLMPQCLHGLWAEDGGGGGGGGNGGGGGGGEAVGAHGGVGLGQDPAPHSAIAHALSLFELLNGTGSIVSVNWGWLIASPAGPSIAQALSHGQPDVHKLDPDTAAAMDRLMVLAAATGPPVADDGGGGDGGGDGSGEGAAADPYGRDRQLIAPAEALVAKADYAVLLDGSVQVLPAPANPSDLTPAYKAEQRGGPAARRRSPAEVRRDMYKNTVFYLRMGFADAHRGAYKFSGIGFPMLGRHEFAAAVARREPLALLLVAYWGVLMGHENNAAWWTGRAGRWSIGRDLVAEISEALVLLEMRGRLGDGFAAMPEWRASISWARTQTGLTAL
ncbi:hypothetical protein RB601_004783 [Gaeumannomyces tritici]